MITAEQIDAQKSLLPRGWGRFGKALDELVSASQPDETLLAACVTLNPSFQHRAISLAGGLVEATGTTNVVVAVTDRRVLVIPTAMGGAPRGQEEIAFEGLQVVERSKKDFVLQWPDATARFKGAAKTMIGPFLDALEAQLAARG